MAIARAFLLLGLVAGLPACGDDADHAPGSELGPCLQGQFCESPLQCVQEICVHPDQLDSSEGGDPSAADGDDSTLSGGASMSSTAGMGDSASASATGAGDGTTSATGADGTGGMTAGDASAGDATAGDATATAGDATASDATVGDGTAGDCVPPECGAYATKMFSCYPMLDIDWLAQCLETADICHIDGPCVTPAAITCSIAMPCDVVVDGGCIEDAC